MSKPEMASQPELQKIAEGREAEMFAWEEGTILRLLRPGFDPSRLENEVRVLGIARACGLPVPAPGQRMTVDGRAGAVLERVEGEDLLTELGRAPWVVFRAARMCGIVHAQMHECHVTVDDVPSLKGRLRQQLSSPLVPADLATLAYERLDGLPDGTVLCHGDFHPANVMRSPKGPVVIDWAHATHGVPEADVARTLLLLGAGEPATYTMLLRVLTKIGRSLLIWLYLRSYRRARSLDMKQVRQWRLPVTVARLAEDIEAERPRLLQRIDRLLASS